MKNITYDLSQTPVVVDKYISTTLVASWGTGRDKKRESALVVPGVPLNPLHTVQNTALRDMYLEKTEFWH